jgi:hypothetical protein
MNEKVIIDNIRKKNSDYNYSEQAQNQYESLFLLTSAFSEYIRFLFELVQNADDAEASEIDVFVQNSVLIVSHNGASFKEEDVVGICNVGAGTKKANTKTTGYKGIGFKSLFGKSTYVVIFSQGFQFRFDESNKQGKFPIMPWQIIPQWTEISELPKDISNFLTDNKKNVSTIIRLELTDELLEDLNELLMSSQILLFLRNIKSISCHGLLQNSIRKVNVSNDVVELIENGEKSKWIVWNSQGEIEENIKAKLKNDKNIPDKIKLASKYEISFAAKLIKDKLTALKENESLIYTYLPTKVNFQFPFLINSNFLADTSRELLYEDNAWNQWLMKIAGEKIVDWLAGLSTTSYALQILHLLPEQSKSTTNRLTSNFFDSFDIYCKTKPFVPNSKNLLKVPNEIVIDETGLSNETGFVTAKVLIDFINKGREERKFKSDAFVNPKLQLAEEKLPALGSVKFDLTNLEDFFTDAIFKDSHQISENFNLIKYFFKKSKNKTE